MHLQGGRVLYSASDLNNFLACRYLTALDLDVVREGMPRPERDDADRDLLAELGEAHERRYLERLRIQGIDVVEIDRAQSLEAAAEQTIAAMQEGREAIYQATFLDGEWMGRADFLRRRPDGSYEVEDTKLARKTEPHFLLQLAYYGEHVARIQGRDPEYLCVVLGDESHERFRYGSVAAYYRAVKAAFIAYRSSTDDAYPYPVPRCGLCEWSARCGRRWKADDHLSLVANITRLQTRRLTEAGITTLEGLGEAPGEPVPPRMERQTFETLRRQARLQLAQRREDAVGNGGLIAPEFLRHDETEWSTKGFGRLPAASPYDVYFDMEGDPYYDLRASLEYLFGVYTHDDRTYRAFWGCDRGARAHDDRIEEKRAFEAFVDFITARHRAHPAMHVYHYGAYEKTKLQELSLRHATREREVDDILRAGLLVDLYGVVRQSIAVGQPGYSIKRLEAYYGKRGEAGVKSGDQSILQFERWKASRYDPATRDDALLDDLAAYNEFDCVSTHGLHGWLIALRERCIAELGVAIPPYVGDVKETSEREDPHAELKLRLAAASREEGDAPWMALQMLDYHWRENKPVYWAFHDRCETYRDDARMLLGDGSVLLDVRFTERRPEKKSVVETYRAPQQEFKVEDGDCYDPATKQRVGTLVRVAERDDGFEVEIKRGPSVQDVAVRDAFVTFKVFDPGGVKDALARFGAAIADGTCARVYPAAYAILTSATPASLDIERLDGSYLFVQGPPGSGKTYAAARMIVPLLAAGKRVGVSANSHRAIHTLLAEIEAVAHATNAPFEGVKKVTKDDPDSHFSSPHGFVRNAEKVKDVAAGLVAGTMYAICALDGEPLDYLFIDEAGQVALPNAIAQSVMARNVVLLGDPLQLPHVAHGSQPGGVGRSVLQHLLGDELRPVAPDRGILLAESYRMNAPVCAFVSEMMYEGRLNPAPGRERQRVDSPGISGQGLRYIPVAHDGNAQRSEEEAATIVDRCEELLRGTVTEFSGAERSLQPSDIIVVTPYNAQVRCIRRALRERGGKVAEIDVGTVDKFQGREAFVVFFSTAASSSEEAPRGIGFIFDRQRLNVAISRARAIAVMVGSPALCEAECHSIDEVLALNAALTFVERAEMARER